MHENKNKQQKMNCKKFVSKKILITFSQWCKFIKGRRALNDVLPMYLIKFNSEYLTYHR